MKTKILVVIPNWNGAAELPDCLASLAKQTLTPHLVLVDNGSTDSSIAYVEQYYPEVEIIRHKENEGYAGGVNPGFRRAIELGCDYVAPFNNDAIADIYWLEHLSACLDQQPHTGIATPKLLSSDRSHLDSTGDYYTSWGLPYPRGRNEADIDKYDTATAVFGASGGASLYRVAMLKEVGLMDEDFFAYYEDVDLSFRAQWAGWKITYVPTAEVYHALSVTGSRIKGFFTYQTMKNLPMLLWKNVPWSLMPTIFPRFLLVYTSFFVSAAQRGQLWYAFKGHTRFLLLLPKKLVERRRIRRGRTVSEAYIRSILTWDLPPNADRWRRIRQSWRKRIGKSA